MFRKLKAWRSSFHRWQHNDREETRQCKCCGVVEKYYEWEGAYWWGVVEEGDSTKPCFEKITSYITPPY